MRREVIEMKKLNLQEDINAINTLLDAGLIEEEEANFMRNYIEELALSDHKYQNNSAA